MSQLTIDQALQLAFQDHQAGRLAEAEGIYRQIIAADPNHFNAVHLLGALAFQTRRFDEAAEFLQRAIRLHPESAAAHYHFGCLLRAQLRFDDALAEFNLAAARKPDFAEAWNNLGICHKELGEIPEAIAAFEKGAQANPAFLGLQSNVLLTLWYDPARNHDDIAQHHFDWGTRHQHDSGVPFANERSPNRKLRIGYVSPDFRRHAVAFFVEPLLAHHNHKMFEVFCYSSATETDEVTERLRQHVNQWRDITRLTDDRATAQIRSDGMDILIDLAGHTAGNRLGIFAQKPAPIQITYLGYPGTTGLRTVDYRLTDGIADPPSDGLADALHTEKLVRLPGPFLCYHPPATPEIHPRDSTAPVTFGCFNARTKINEPLIAMWVRILHAAPASRLLLKNHGLAASSSCTRLIDAFGRHNITPDRLDLRGPVESFSAHLETYNEIDIALDTYPYTGATTTCEALWMGVPVITLSGPAHVSRVSDSILTAIGETDLIAPAPSEYCSLAVRLAGDVSRRASLRATLREHMRSSPLMNPTLFASTIEDTYRTLWLAWCKS